MFNIIVRYVKTRLCRVVEKIPPYDLLNWLESHRDIFHKYKDGLYLLEFSLPPASHSDSFLAKLQLTAAEAKLYNQARYQRTYFASDYADAKWRQVAKDLENKLTTTYPQNRWPVGVIFSCTLVNTSTDTNND